jgi:hypothetical protein
MTIKEKLISRLQAEGVDVVEVRRIYAGHWQRSSGAWSWVGVNAQGVEMIGSQQNMGFMVKATKDEFEGWLDT